AAVRAAIACWYSRPARYDERTSGPLITPANPIRSASAASATNSSGFTHRRTGWWRGLGRRYWVMVISSQPAWYRSTRACETSSGSSPNPRIRLDLVTRPASRACVITSSERWYENAGRIRRKIRGTVSRLCASTSGRASNTSASRPGLPSKSGISSSTPHPGTRAWICGTVSAYSQAPPSGRSSRARFVRVERRRLTGVDLAEVAPPGALVTADQEGRFPVLPTLVDVGAAGLLAHGVQPFPGHQGAELAVLRPHLRLDLDPRRLAL